MCFYLEGTEYCFTTLTFYLILISVVLSGVTVVLHWKINLENSKRGQHELSYTVIVIHYPQNYLKNSIGKHFQKELHIKKQF